MENNSRGRPHRITALSIFFGAGAVISFTAALALLVPTSFLSSMWVLNPRAYQAFHEMKLWALVLLFTVSCLCLLTSVGLWHGKLWGYKVAIGLLFTNLIGDIYNVVSGTEPRVIIGIPIVMVILIFITRPAVRAYFRSIV